MLYLQELGFRTPWMRPLAHFARSCQWVCIPSREVPFFLCYTAFPEKGGLCYHLVATLG